MKKSNIQRLTVSTYAIVIPTIDYAIKNGQFLYAPCEQKWAERWLVLKWNPINETFENHPQDEYEDEHDAINAAMEYHNLTLKQNEGGEAHGGIDDKPMEAPLPE